GWIDPHLPGHRLELAGVHLGWVHVAQARHHAAHLAAEHAGERAHAAFADLLHHVRHLAVLLHQFVDVLDPGAGAVGDADAALGIEQVGVGALGLGHRVDDGDLPVEDLFVEIGAGHGLLDLAHARHHPHEGAHAAHLLHLQQLPAQILEVEAALLELLGHLGRVFGVDGLRRLLDEADDVAHAEDAVGDGARAEVLERVELFAGADELDRLAGRGAHRERRAAAAIAVDAAQDDAGDVDALVERARQVHGILAGERVGNEQDLVRIDRRLYRGRLLHQLFVDMGAAGGIEDDDVVAAEPGLALGAARDLDRSLVLQDRQGVDADLRAQHAQLLLG